MSLRGNKTSSKSSSSRHFQAGQAATEYILLLAITISLVILFKEFYSKVIGPRISFMVGGYIECLLETGQLPSLSDAQAKQDFESIARGSECRMPAAGSYGSGGTGGSGGGGGGSGGGGGGSGGSGGSGGGSGGSGSSGGGSGSGGSSGSGSTGGTKLNNSGSSQSNAANPNSGYSSTSSSSGGDSSGSGRSDPTQGRARGGVAQDRRSILPIKNSKDISGTDGNLAGAAGATQRVENSAMDDFGDEYGKRGRRSRGNRNYRGISGGMQEAYERQEAEKSLKPPAAGKKILPAPEVLGGIKEERRVVEPPPPRKVANLDEGSDQGFQFGTIFKFLLIAGIIIAIVIFFGGQIMNYSKSQEK